MRTSARLRLTARPGFTLLEIVCAAAVLAVIMAALMQTFFGTQRAQATAVASNLLKVAGQKAIQTMYVELSQARKILASTNQDLPAKDVGKEYFLKLQSVSSAIPSGNMKFPRVDADGGFGLPGTASGELEQNTVGNTLVFVTADKPIRLKTPWIAITGMSGFFGLQLLSDTPYILNPVRLVAYYIGEKALPTGVKLNGGRTASQQLMRWESQLYLERSEFETLNAKLAAAPVSTVAVWDDLTTNHKIVGLWDRTAATADASLMTVNGSGAVVAMPAASRVFQKRRQSQVAQTSLEPFAIGMVAYNTNVNFAPVESGQTLAVPAYAPTDAANAVYPFGFETAIVGPNSARQVLIRLSLAARVRSGGRLLGHSHQEVVRVFDN